MTAEDVIRMTPAYDGFGAYYDEPDAPCRLQPAERRSA